MGENLNLCLGCMEPKVSDGICPYCGYSDSTPYLPSYIAPGTILNERYLIGRLLRYCGEGATYIAYDSVTNRKVLVKEYMPDTLCTRVKGSPVISVNQRNLVQYKALMSEFTELNKILARMRTLNHINPALELFAENNTTYVVFEYIDGMTLKDYLQENAGELSWEEVKKLFPPIFTTLSLIHNSGLVHRGISPETIWITKKGELKLTDFSIAANRTANTEIASELFAGYAAPEQYSSSNWQGTWTDVYAISAVLYRMLTGCMPIEAISRIGNDNLSEPALLNPNIPPNVSKVIMCGLKLSGDMRIQTVTELVTKLFEQPEYMDASRTATIAVPRQSIRMAEDTMKNSIKSKKKPAKFQKLRIMLIVFGIMIVILTVMGLALWNWFDSGTPADSSVSGSSSLLESQMLKAESVTEATTAPPAPAAGDTIALDENKDYQIPNFVGKNYDTIKGSVSYQDWLVFLPKPEYNEQYEKGVIFEQSIPENEYVAKGAQIEVKVSQGSKNVVVPDYFGKAEDDYISLLGDIKYTVVYMADSGYMDGVVIRTSKEPGETIDVSIGEILTIYVSDNSQASSSNERKFNFN